MHYVLGVDNHPATLALQLLALQIYVFFNFFVLYFEYDFT